MPPKAAPKPAPTLGYTVQRVRIIEGRMVVDVEWARLTVDDAGADVREPVLIDAIALPPDATNADQLAAIEARAAVVHADYIASAGPVASQKTIEGRSGKVDLSKPAGRRI